MLSGFRFWLMALTALALCACSAPQPRTSDLEGEHHLVRLGPSGAAGNRLMHPFDLEEAQLGRLLAALRYEEAGLMSRDGPQPVFDPDEVDQLASGLSRALSTANPDQRVDFVSHRRTGTSFGNARKTEGTVFVEDGGLLNIAFAGIRQVMTVDDDFTRFRDISLGDPLAVNRAMVRLAAGNDTVEAKRRPDGSHYPLWITIALETGDARDSAPERHVEPEAAPIERASSDRSTRATDDVETETRRPIERQAPVPEPLAPAAPAQVRERLEFLRTLYEDGLITAQEYQRERERALRQLD